MIALVRAAEFAWSRSMLTFTGFAIPYISFQFEFGITETELFLTKHPKMVLCGTWPLETMPSSSQLQPLD